MQHFGPSCFPFWSLFVFHFFVEQTSYLSLPKTKMENLIWNHGKKVLRIPGVLCFTDWMYLQEKGIEVLRYQCTRVLPAEFKLLHLVTLCTRCGVLLAKTAAVAVYSLLSPLSTKLSNACVLSWVQRAYTSFVHVFSCWVLGTGRTHMPVYFLQSPRSLMFSCPFALHAECSERNTCPVPV